MQLVDKKGGRRTLRAAMITKFFAQTKTTQEQEKRRLQNCYTIEVSYG